MRELDEQVVISVHDLLAVIRLTGEVRQELLSVRGLIEEGASLSVQEAVKRGLEELGGIDRITAAWYGEASRES